MICYMNKTSQTLAHDDEDLVIWREAIPDEAVHHDFLMDGLLAMAALHFAYENPESRLQYTELAMRYQNSSLQVYNKALENINEENCTALFAFSIIVNVMAIALPNTIPDSLPSSYTESITTMLALIRGIGLIHSSAVSKHRTGRLASFYRPLPPDLQPDDETTAALESLRHEASTLLASKSIEYERHAVYLSAIQSLEVAFGCMKATNHLGRIIGWPASLGSPGHCEELMRLFNHGDVMTQLIFMYYGVLLLHTRHRWWGRHTGVSLIKELAISVRAAGPNWVVGTQWPIEVARRSVEKDQSASYQRGS
ncbi:hypothetical protein PTMSG1_00338 [Pyrenophora teres f. maculata]|nr:hypothetical protein PTMSG1_00338 [Pyrenophora teres f. maculata]